MTVDKHVKLTNVKSLHTCLFITAFKSCPFHCHTKNAILCYHKTFRITQHLSMYKFYSNFSLKLQMLQPFQMNSLSQKISQPHQKNKFRLTTKQAMKSLQEMAEFWKLIGLLLN